MHATPALGNKGRARKSPKTLLRLYAEGQLKGPEARQAAALLAEQNSEKGLCAPQESDENKSSDTLSLSEARRVIRAVEAARPRNAYELHIVTSVPPNQTNAFRGRISYPKDPRIKGETVLVFAEQGSEAADAAQLVASQLEARLVDAPGDRRE